MNTRAHRLRTALNEMPDRVSMAEVARALKLSVSTTRGYFSETRDPPLNPPLDKCLLLGKVLDVRGEWIFSGKGPKKPEPAVAATQDIIEVPLLDSVAASKLTRPMSQIPVEEVPLLAFADLGPGEFFALKVIGSSMDRISPENSTIIVNRRDRQLISGKCYVFGLRGETTYKRWQGGDPEYLEPYSTETYHKPIFLGKKKDWEVIGRVKRTVLDL